MDLEVSGQLVERALPFDGLHSHLCLEFSTVLFALSFHYLFTGYIMVSYQSPSKPPVQFLGSTILAVTVALGIACRVGEKLQKERGVRPAVESAAYPGSVPGDRLRQKRVILEHVIAAACIARSIGVDAVGAQVNAQPAVRKNGIAKNRVARAPSTDAHPSVNGLAETNAIAGTGICSTDRVIARVGAF